MASQVVVGSDTSPVRNAINVASQVVVGSDTSPVRNAINVASQVEVGTDTSPFRNAVNVTSQVELGSDTSPLTVACLWFVECTSFSRGVRDCVVVVLMSNIITELCSLSNMKCLVVICINVCFNRVVIVENFVVL